MHFRTNYTDGTFFEWDEDTPSESSYSKIDRTKLQSVELSYSGKLVHRLHLEKGQRLILRRRVQRQMFSEALREIYLVGYQETINGINRQAITAIFDDGHTELIGSWKSAPLDSVNLLQVEKQ